MKRRRTRPVKGSRAYRQLWRVVDGAVADAFMQHPNYLTDAGRMAAQLSITKRVVGAVMSYAEQSAKGRSGASPAAEKRPEGCYPPRSRFTAFLTRGVRKVWEALVTRFPHRPA